MGAQHTTRPSAAASNDATGFCSVYDAAFGSSTSTPTNATLPSGSKSRPLIHKKTGNEPAVYNQLPSFPDFDTPIPPEATLEEICVRYPNHLRGSYLDAFIQWHWTANDIYRLMTDLAKAEVVAHGISKCKSTANRANFLAKRLDGRMNTFNEEEMTELCRAPKIRRCFVNDGAHYGRSKLQGKFKNRFAQPLRVFPDRQERQRTQKTPQESAFADAMTKSINCNGKEFPIWNTQDEVQEFVNILAIHWNQLRLCADTIVNADFAHRDSRDSHRHVLMLQLMNWPCNSVTAGFFCYSDVGTNPQFPGVINDMLGGHVIAMLDTIPHEELLALSEIDFAQRVISTRQEAVRFAQTAQAARLARLQEFMQTIPTNEAFHGVVDFVRSWDVDTIPATEPSTQFPSQPVVGNELPSVHTTPDLTAIGLYEDPAVPDSAIDPFLLHDDANSNAATQMPLLTSAFIPDSGNAADSNQDWLEMLNDPNLNLPNLEMPQLDNPSWTGANQSDLFNNVHLTVEPTREEIFNEFSVNNVPNVNRNDAAGLWGLPEMQNSDPDWLREAMGF